MEEKYVEFASQARYYVEGDIRTANEIWFILHGHGQLARYFSRKFSTLLEKKICLIFPEGLSKYYLAGHAGRVGATWMTREDRLNDINNYVGYLNSVYKQVYAQLNESVKITALGFSQGTATISRWVAQSDVHIDRMILWAGIFPPDMEIATASERFSAIEVLNVYGTQDEFLNEEKLVEQQQIIKQLGIDPKTIEFNGNHDIHPPTLEQIVMNA